MDIILIIIILIIVVAIGYILSRPFTNTNAMREAPSTIGDYEFQYRMLINEIKDLEEDCESSDKPDEVCEEIDEKKEKAANLLRLINPPLEREFTTQRPVPPPDKKEAKPDQYIPKDGTYSYICPHCGSKVKSSDKFCTHCGHRLQP